MGIIYDTWVTDKAWGPLVNLVLIIITFKKELESLFTCISARLLGIYTNYSEEDNF